MREILEKALTLEKEGYQLYMETASQSQNPLTRQMLESLAGDEKRHMDRIFELKEEFEAEGQWPEDTEAPGPPLDMEKRMKRIFEELGKPEPSDQEDVVKALEKALGFEEDSRQLYRDAAADTENPAAASFFRALAEEERQHSVAIKNVHSYYTQTGDWMAEDESQVWNWMNI